MERWIRKVAQPVDADDSIFTLRSGAVCGLQESKGKGPFTNDVSREGEGGGWPISDERKGGCVDLVLTRGGVKNPENLADVICERPLKRL